MFIVPLSVEFGHEVTWKIQDFLLCPIRHTSFIFSPEFFIKCSELTSWKLCIYMKNSGEDIISFAIKREDSNSPLEKIKVDFHIYVIDIEGEQHFHKSGSLMASQKAHHIPGVDFFRLELLQKDHLHEDTLVIKCELVLVIDQEALLKRTFDEHLISLSKDIYNLLDSGEFSDFTLIAQNSEFKVHSWILRARWPGLKVNNEENSQRTMTLEISAKVLEIMLKYVYSKILVFTPSDLRLDLLMASQKYKLPDLEVRLTNFPVECSLVTPMLWKKLSFEYDLTHIKQWKQPITPHVRILPISNMSVQDLMVKFQMSSDPEDGDRFLDISFQFSTFNKCRPVSISGNMSISDQNGVTLDSCALEKVFLKDEEWKLPPFFKRNKHFKNMEDSVKSLNCEFLICNGVDEVNALQENCLFTIRKPVCFLNDFTKLGDDLEALLDNSKQCDFKLKCSDRAMRLHKQIICSRSTEFRKIFSKKYSYVKFPVRIMKTIISYIYSGKVRNINQEDAAELLKAASHFNLPLLRKCLLVKINGIVG